MPFGDEDEIMEEDLEGQDLDAMTRQLVSFREPGNALHDYVSLPCRHQCLMFTLPCLRLGGHPMNLC